MTLSVFVNNLIMIKTAWCTCNSTEAQHWVHIILNCITESQTEFKKATDG